MSANAAKQAAQRTIASTTFKPTATWPTYVSPFKSKIFKFLFREEFSTLRLDHEMLSLKYAQISRKLGDVEMEKSFEIQKLENKNAKQEEIVGLLNKQIQDMKVQIEEQNRMLASSSGQ